MIKWAFQLNNNTELNHVIEVHKPGWCCQQF